MANIAEQRSDIPDKEKDPVLFLKERVLALFIVDYLTSDNHRLSSEEEWRREYEQKLTAIIDLHLRHSNPTFWNDDNDIFNKMLGILKEELYKGSKEDFLAAA